MLIECKTANLSSLNQVVNIFGKYLFKHLDGSIKFKKSSNMYDIWTIVLYQIPYEVRNLYDISEDKYKEVYEMLLNINITTYGTKLRINILEETPDNLTLGCKTFDIEKVKLKHGNEYLKFMLKSLETYVRNRISKQYENYDFLF